MAKITHRTTQNQTLDQICWSHYGHTGDRVVERVLEHNQGLASLGPIFPSGTLIQLPDIDVEEQENDTINLWD